jgi:hypothetical protein
VEDGPLDGVAGLAHLRQADARRLRLLSSG